uniref:(California timema) hypothetical protein n=1 Tax=Timema californicum TaxID=61474 RepID=A0A7R9P966_TIMCA|nr:unnamed protein product [Timema californicum]
MDSVASSHMTWNIYYFDNFEEVSDGSSMHIGEIHKLSGKGRGDVMIRRLLSGHWYDSVIRDVLLVPDLKKNLMSEGKITTSSSLRLFSQPQTISLTYVDGECRCMVLGCGEQCDGMDEVSDYMKVVEKSANKSVTSLHQLNTVLQQQRQQPRLRNGAR